MSIFLEPKYTPRLLQDRIMMSSRDTAADLKRLVHIFRLIVTKDSAALDVVNETLEKEPELLARELTFSCGRLFL